jgi:AcrR family transcriptional regulator
MRSAETRGRLIEAALDHLHHHGYARTATADIAVAAGVSRGALTHHFASKDDLVAEAVDHELKQATREIASLAEEVSAGRLDLDAFLDRLWAMFSGRLFLITLEHVTEARHNEALHDKLVPLVKAFHGALDGIWRTFFRTSGLPEAEIGAALNATLCLLRGMGVQTVLRDDPAYYRALLGFWKRQLKDLVGDQRAGPGAKSVSDAGRVDSGKVTQQGRVA